MGKWRLNGASMGFHGDLSGDSMRFSGDEPILMPSIDALQQPSDQPFDESGALRDGQIFALQGV